MPNSVTERAVRRSGGAQPFPRDVNNASQRRGNNQAVWQLCVNAGFRSAGSGVTLLAPAARAEPVSAGTAGAIHLDTMEDAPWMLALNGAGNCRATNLLGNNSIAAYVNSSVTSESWGALSTDSGTRCTLVAVNSVVGNTGDSGYGTYSRP
jgi:hypothetical protein